MRVTPEQAVTVKLNGEIVPSFISADDQDGWVRTSPTEVLRGKVEFLTLDDARPSRARK